jgi:organic hydroperoxide reductase OsmC/OhrA
LLAPSRKDDDCGLAVGRLRTLREVQDAATRALEATGAGDLLGVTAFAADDGRVYKVVVTAVVQEAEPELSHDLIADALANCPTANAARHEVLDADLRHLKPAGK